MNIQKATTSFESWMATHIQVINADLRFKHAQMAASPFVFMRGTYYRWSQIWKDRCPEANNAPTVLAVGDLHVENFGTWRDAEGRLIWGVNDFDEASRLPYTLDLVRLATSAYLAIKAEHLCIRPRKASQAILEGYRDGLREGGRPFVLDENHGFLREIALSKLRDPVHFWGRMRALPDFKGDVTPDQGEALKLLLPEPSIEYKVKARRAGVGSLGRPRLAALAMWRGGLIAREIKAVLPPAAAWTGQQNSERIWYTDIMTCAVRVPDPFMRFHDRWIVRRLAPDCSRIELWSLPKKRDEASLLHAMGYETANIHLGSPIPAIQKDLDKRPPEWLHDHAKTMANAVTSDWNDFVDEDSAK
jgi:hypothetical protein